MKKLEKLARVFILWVILAPIDLFGQNSISKEYFSYPLLERYNDREWINVSEPTFWWMTSYGVEPASPDTNLFRIYTDLAGNNYYWVRQVKLGDSISEVFSEKEKPAEILIENFFGEFVIKYPYAQDTAFVGTPKFYLQKKSEDSLSLIGKTLYRFDELGNLLSKFSIINHGEFHINMLIQSTLTGKEVELRGESSRYGVLCRFVRHLMIYENPKEAIVRFLESCGRGRDIEQNMSFLANFMLNLAPEAIKNLPEFKPLPIPKHAVEASPGDSEKKASFSTKNSEIKVK